MNFKIEEEREKSYVLSIKNTSKLIKQGGEKIFFEIDKEDLDLIKDFKIHYTTRLYNNGEKFYAAFMLIYKKSLEEDAISLSSFLLKTDKKTYLKDRYLDNKILNYKKDNIVFSQKEMIGYSELAKKRLLSQDMEYKKRMINEKRYTKKYSRSLSIANANAVNPTYVHNFELAKEIRYDHNVLGLTHTEISENRSIPRTSITDIINYRTWAYRGDEKLRVYSQSNIKEVIYSEENKPVNINKYCNSDKFSNRSLLKIINKEINVYIEKLPLENLIYIEIRDKDNNFLFNVDLYFPPQINKRTKKEYIISSRNPSKTKTKEIQEYLDIISKSLY